MSHNPNNGLNSPDHPPSYPPGQDPNYSNTLKVTERGVELQYTKYGAGCMVVAMGVMTAASLFVLRIAPDYKLTRAFLMMVIGIVGTLFFGSILLQLFAMLMRGKTVIRIEDGYLINRKHRVPLETIAEITYGWHNKRLSGRVFEELVVRTVHKKTYYYRSYNVLPDGAVRLMVERHILPYATQECRTRWEAEKTKDGEGS